MLLEAALLGSCAAVKLQMLMSTLGLTKSQSKFLFIGGCQVTRRAQASCSSQEDTFKNCSARR